MKNRPEIPEEAFFLKLAKLSFKVNTGVQLDKDGTVRAIWA